MARRRRGRPRMRLVKNGERDLREIKVKRWLHMAVDREEWSSVIKEARAIGGLQSAGTRPTVVG